MPDRDRAAPAMALARLQIDDEHDHEFPSDGDDDAQEDMVEEPAPAIDPSDMSISKLTRTVCGFVDHH